MAIYTGIGGSAKSVSKIYTGVGGTARPVHKGYIGVDGVAKKFYDGGNPISSFALGTKFGIADPSGTTRWYKLVHKGVPGGGLYDSTANGAWLWRTNVAGSTAIDSSNYIYGYEGCALDNWCVNYPGGNITPSVANRLMTVHLPYVKRADYSSAKVSSGSNGLSRKCFLLSAVEMGVYTWQGIDGLMAQEGAKLDYFDYTTAATDKRKADTEYWTRSKRSYNGNYMYTFYADGSFSSAGRHREDSYGLRPCIVLPLNTLVTTVTGFLWLEQNYIN